MERTHKLKVGKQRATESDYKLLSKLP